MYLRKYFDNVQVRNTDFLMVYEFFLLLTSVESAVNSILPMFGNKMGTLREVRIY